MERVLGRGLELDEDTSAKNATTVQQRWDETLMQNLRDTGG
jgi:hypothetical protein